MLSKYTNVAVFIAAMVLFAGALTINSGCGKAGGSLDVYSIVEAPVFSPSAGTYASAQTVSISSQTPGATIYYTTDDSEPKETSTKYTGALSVDVTVRIRAKAYLSPKVPSTATSALYDITGTVAAPTFSPEAGTYASTQNVAISCLTSGARITYTTDGTTPIESSPLYEDLFPVAATTTVKAKAFLSDYASSEVQTAIYYIGQEAPLSFSPVSGTVEGEAERTITLTGATGTTIYYTTDGTDPTVSSSSSPTPAEVPIELDSSSPVKTQTIKAFAMQSGKVASPISSETYTLSLTSEVDVIDSVGDVRDVGMYSSITIGSSVTRHISYLDWTNRAIKHTYRSGSSWSLPESIASSIGEGSGYTSIAISSDTVHVAYYDQSAGELKHAYSTASPWNSWNIGTVDSGVAKAFPSIAVDPSGAPNISYYDSNPAKKVRHAYCKPFPGSWDIEDISENEIDLDNKGRSAISVDNSGYIYVIFHDDGKIKSKTNAPLGSFVTKEVEDYSPEKFYLDIALGSGTGSGISVYAIFCTPSLQYSKSEDSGTSWGAPVSINSSTNLQHLSLAVDKRGGSDILHISAYDASSQTLKYFTNSSGQWKEYCIDDSLKVGTYSSIAVDDDGYFHISYYDETNGDLKYATNKH